jgi:hypothetical protein
MNRSKAIRVADVWRVGSRTQQAGSPKLTEHESISAAKRFTRGQKCVALVDDDQYAGEQVFGFFRSDDAL